MELAGSLDPEELAPRSSTASSRSWPTACTASRARSTSTPATGSWRCSARRSRTRTTRSAPATRRSTCARSCAAYADELRRAEGLSLLDAHGPQLRRGRGRQDRRRPAHGLHRAGSGRLAGAADGVARGAGPDLPVRRTRRAWSSGLFELADLGEFALKGVAEPAQRPRARRRRHARAGASTSRARAGSPASWAATRRWPRSRRRWSARDNGHGQVVGVVAEAGVGKSRLCFEFLERCRASGIAVLRGARRLARQEHPVPPDARAVPQLVRDHASRTASEPRARRSRAGCCCSTRASATCCRSSSSSSASRIRSGPRRGSTPTRASASSSRCCAGSCARARRGQPTVTLIEDLHWIDGSSDAFLAQWVEAIESSRGLLVVQPAPRVPRRVDGALVLPADRAGAARGAGGRASCSPTCSGATRARAALAAADPAAHRRQSVLHRGGRAVARRVRAARRARRAATG